MNCMTSDHMAAHQRSLGLAIVSCAISVGESLSPVIVNSISGILTSTVRVKFIVAAAVLGVTAAVSIVYFSKKAKAID